MGTDSSHYAVWYILCVGSAARWRRRCLYASHSSCSNRPPLTNPTEVQPSTSGRGLTRRGLGATGYWSSGVRVLVSAHKQHCCNI